MYELWLMLNIGWEILLEVWPLAVVTGATWLLLVALASRRPRAQWQAARRIALVAGAGAAGLAFLALPALTGSSLALVGYWVDWANLLAMAGAAGIGAAAFAWPAAVLAGSRRGRGELRPREARIPVG